MLSPRKGPNITNAWLS